MGTNQRCRGRSRGTAGKASEESGQSRRISEVRDFITTNHYDDLNTNGTEQDYWDSFIKYERPLVDYITSKINTLNDKDSY